MTFRYSVDDRLSGVWLNGHSQGITGAGFGTLSGIYRLTNGFVSGLNTLEFQTLNDGTGVNPVGFRVQMSGTARKQLASNTLLPAGRTHYYFRGKCRAHPAATCRRAARPSWRMALLFEWHGSLAMESRLFTLILRTNVPNPVLFEPFALPSHALDSHQCAGGGYIRRWMARQCIVRRGTGIDYHLLGPLRFRWL